MMKVEDAVRIPAPHKGIQWLKVHGGLKGPPAVAAGDS